jgi:hypothetical protein
MGAHVGAMVEVVCCMSGTARRRHLSTATVAGDLLRISRAIQTALREAERTR